MNLELLRPHEDMEKMFHRFTSDWASCGEMVVPSSVHLLDMDYHEWLACTYAFEKRETCPPEYVPAHTYFLVQDGVEIIGAVSIRHELSAYLLHYGGHIGYGIRPSERQKGYAPVMLNMALSFAKSHGLKRVLLVCDKQNEASAHTILRCGGQFENEVEHEGECLQRYWIQL